MILMVDFNVRRKEKLNEIIKDLKKVRGLNSREPPRSIIKRLEKFRDQEL